MRRYDFTKNMKGRGKKIQEVLNWEGALEKQLEESFRMDSTGGFAVREQTDTQQIDEYSKLIMNKDGRPLLTAVIIYQRIKPEKSGHYSVHLDGVLSVVSSQYGQAELNKFLGIVQPDKLYDRSGKYARNVPLTHPKKQ